MLDKGEGVGIYNKSAVFAQLPSYACCGGVGGGGAELKIPSSKQKNEQKARIEPAKSISDDCWSWLAMVFFF